MNKDDLTILHELALFAPPGDLYLQAFDGHPFMEAANSLRGDAPYGNPNRKALDDKLANYDNIANQLDAANAKIAELEKAPALAPSPDPTPVPGTVSSYPPTPANQEKVNIFVALWKALFG